MARSPQSPEVPALTLIQYWILLYTGSHRSRSLPVKITEITDACWFTTADVPFHGGTIRGSTFSVPIDADLDAMGPARFAEAKEMTTNEGFKTIYNNTGGCGLLRCAERLDGVEISGTLRLSGDGVRHAFLQEKGVIERAEREIEHLESQSEECMGKAEWRRGVDKGGARDFTTRAIKAKAILTAVKRLVKDVLPTLPLVTSARAEIASRSAELDQNQTQRIDDEVVGFDPSEFGSIQVPNVTPGQSASALMQDADPELKAKVDDARKEPGKAKEAAKRGMAPVRRK